MSLSRRQFFISSCLAFLAACAGANQLSPAKNSTTLIVSAAASLQGAIEAIGDVYTQENLAKTVQVSIVHNFGSSGSLQQQIEQGAPVDVFISAAPKQMDALQEKDLLRNETRRDLLNNRIVLITPLDVESVSSFEDLITNTVNKVSIGDPNSVPAGEYARETLAALGLYETLQEQQRLVFAKDVRQVLSYVALGNVEAGLVYATDAATSAQVQPIMTAPEGTHQPIIYPVAVVKQTQNPQAAQQFVEFLSSDAAAVIFAEFGFSMVQ